MSKLPAEWAACSLADIGQIVTGKTPSTKEPSFYGGSIPFIKPGDLDHSGPIVTTETFLTNAGAAEIPNLPPQSIVVTCIGNLGKVGLTTTTSATNQQINALIPETGIDPSFVFHYCKTLRPWLEAQSSATTISIVNKSIFSKAPIPLPPAAEQTRIAAKLDELLAQVRTLKARIHGIPALLKRFRQSVLASATSGRLTEEWREQNPGEVDPDEIMQARSYALGNKVPYGTVHADISADAEQIPDGWLLCTFDALCEIKHGYAFSSEFFSDAGPIVLTPGNFTEDGNLDFKDKRVVRLKGEYDPRWTLNNGDILIVMTDLSPKKLILGKAAKLISNEVVLHNQRIGKIIPFSKQVSKDFLRLALLAPKTKQQIDELATGTVVQHTSPKKILATLALLPPFAEQIEIVRRVEKLFAFADQLEARVKSAEARIDHLTQSILAKAFRGELVPQDPNDEPASLLLERIKALRAIAPKAKRRRRSA